MRIVIVGAGQVGRHLAELLSKQDHSICVIEASDQLAAELNEQLDAQVICRSGASATTLAEANVADCELFLAVTSDDNTNLVSASLAKAMGAPKTIARVHTGVQRDEWLFDYKGHFGIDYVFSSERLAAVELAKFVRNPEGLLVEELARGRIELQQTFVAAESDAVGQTLTSLALPPRVRIGAIRRNGVYLIPTAHDQIEAGDLLTLFGEPNKISAIVPRFQPQKSQSGETNVVIFGGGDYGFALAQMLEGRELRVRVIEKDTKLCRELSNLLQDTVVINGDATSLQQLREEQMGAADFFIAVTADDEDNVMACLQARNLGTKYCLAVVHRADYADVVERNSEQLGIMAAVSPRVATSRDLLRFVTSDSFHVMMKLDERAELIESVVAKNGRLAGQKVSDVKWPDGSGLVALLRGQQAIVPAGNDIIEPGDTLYAIVSEDAKRRFVKLLSH
ncbi:MAG: Trk system potassium transporter TrkA [Verrucomicrobia bacterium]|nr:Trk system potassium transporter TrkA [Verrucomicrobiota bacterium]